MIPGILTYFAVHKRGNRWNSTKATAMIIYALCDYLVRRGVDPTNTKMATFTVNDGRPRQVHLDGGAMVSATVKGARLREGRNVIRFKKAAPHAMYRLVFRYFRNGRGVKPMDSGIKVSRSFYLLDEKGKRKVIKPGDAVPEGAYLLSEVHARAVDGRAMRYVLVENPKPSGSEILPADDKRFVQTSTAHVLRETKTGSVFYHHEQTGAVIVDRCVLHAELGGVFIVPPARVEMMYDTAKRGHSGTFHFKVVRDQTSEGTSADRSGGQPKDRG